MENIEVNPEEIPVCPECGSRSWLVKQRIERSSDLIRVDRFNDLVVGDYDQDEYLQSLLMRCHDCGSQFIPNYGLSATAEHKGRPGKVEAYTNNEGGELYKFPGRVSNLDETGEDL